jgi:TonB family protein
MNIKLVTCWLLFALGGSAALAQTHPKKKPSRKPVVVHEPGRTRAQEAEEAFIQRTYTTLKHDCDQVGRYAQPEPLDPSPVYTYVEQMPTLNGQNALTASIATISQYLVVPSAAPDGRVFVKFEVDKEGYVRHAKVVKGLRADLDSAVVTATRQLPRFTPGKQNGRVVRVSFTLPVTIPVKKQL